MNLIKLNQNLCFQRGKLIENHTHHFSLSHNHPYLQAQSHAYHAIHAHAHHAYTRHAFLYAKMYTCTYCGHQGHLAKFCYNRINTSNDHVWVRKTNTFEPKKVWVPKLINLLLNIGTHQGSKM